MKHNSEYHWTQEEDKRLIEVYNTLKTSELLVAFPSRDLRSIYKRAHRVGLPRRSGLHDHREPSSVCKVNYWSQEQETLLREKYPIATKDELLILFPDRTPNALSRKALKLGIPDRKGLRQKRETVTREEYIARKSASRKASYRKARKEDPRSHMVSDARRRAKQKGLEITIHFRDFEIPSVCPVLGIPLIHAQGYPSDNSPSLDRKDVNKGYTKENTWVISYRANRIKNNATLDELRKLVVALERELT